MLKLKGAAGDAVNTILAMIGRKLTEEEASTPVIAIRDASWASYTAGMLREAERVSRWATGNHIGAAHTASQSYAEAAKEYTDAKAENELDAEWEGGGDDNGPTN